MPTVSICLPVYNGAKYLAQAIDSVLSQTFADFELIIADDRSTDDSQAIIKSYQERDKRVKAWTNDTNLGHYPNYNACLKAASGKYVKLFAQDDLFEPTILECMVEVLEKNSNVSVVACERQWIGANNEPLPVKSEVDIKMTKPYSQDTILPGAEAIVATLKEQVNWLGEPVCQMFHRQFITGGFDESFRQIGDLDLTYQALLFGDYYFIAQPLCRFRRHSDSWTTSNLAKLGTYLDWIHIAAKYPQYLPKTGLTAEQYCLSFMKSWVRDLECQLNAAGRLGSLERDQVLRELCGNVPTFSLFKPVRDDALEMRALSAMGLLQSSLLEHELRLVHDEIARPYTDVSQAPAGMVRVRPDLAIALESMKHTLREQDKEIKSLRAELGSMGNSMSWKLTEPLRKLKGQKSTSGGEKKAVKERGTDPF